MSYFLLACSSPELSAEPAKSLCSTSTVKPHRNPACWPVEALKRPELVTLASWPANTCHRRQIAMGFVANPVLETNVVSQSVDEARLPIAAVILGIVIGDDIRELRRADPAATFEGGHLVGMRRTGRVDESLFVDDIPSS